MGYARIIFIDPQKSKMGITCHMPYLKLYFNIRNCILIDETGFLYTELL